MRACANEHVIRTSKVWYVRSMTRRATEIACCKIKKKSKNRVLQNKKSEINRVLQNPTNSTLMTESQNTARPGRICSV
jgi:hypothetical protein